MKQKISLVAIVIAATCFVSCNNLEKKDQHETKKSEMVKESKAHTISEQEVLEVQKIWGEGIVKIGKVYSEKGDYKAAAKKHIADLYGYNLGTVLFKPTLAAEKQFRTTEEGALSYFVGHNENYPEDHGFAIKPWTNVRWESTGIKTEGNMAIAMGNYFFTPAGGGDEVKVEYTFAYTKDSNGKLRIILHGSHLPYSPK
ncbi:phosphoribosyl-AMP cyclohydrolase [Marinifilum sp.]|uniref:phosphoribosyl-AMP cyclohydrolase n=1 Tax=Marinifilum sp. TaxID=2033137 RepID=UPI003BAA10BF